MTDPAQEEERRELERRAFGRDGSGLSRDEAARLTALRRAALPLPTGSVQRQAAVSLPTGSLSEDGEADRDETQRNEGPPHAAPAPPMMSRSSDGSGDVVGETGQRRLFETGRAGIRAWLATGRWKRPRYLVGGLAGLLLVGVLIGVAIPRPPDIGLALREGEGAREAAVAAANDDFDPGSLLLLAREHEGLLWYASQANGNLICGILDVSGAPSQKQCQTREQVGERPLYVSSQQDGASPQLTGVTSGDGYAGTIILTARGQPLAVLNRYQMMYDGASGMSADERAMMKRVVSANHLVYAQIVGRVGKIPVWLGDDGTGGRCLVVEDGGMQKTCAPSSDVTVDPFSGEEQPSLSMSLGQTAAHPAVRLEFWAPPYAGQYLVVTPEDRGFWMNAGAAN
ncbi:hypothetical protein LXM50_17600 [Microbacterium sp. Au-Mic1]|uniref:hypothetical protein n=1 Tax=Microbacterium sp. Au-Mic1 TaxID=2906457 RepID=UPI001E34A99D|nr:hypothetical protein [Microbacterium sp. Au-Mic1]MCE4027794.1 hypothetical protein [Microbacterium sp. Au-Mic1]